MSIADFLPLMPATVQLRKFTGRDTYGKPSFAAPTSFRARVVRKQKLVRQPDGQLVMSAGQVWFASATVVTPEDQVELEDGTTPPILSVETPADDVGPHHTKVFFA